MWWPVTFFQVADSDMVSVGGWRHAYRWWLVTCLQVFAGDMLSGGGW